MDTKQYHRYALACPTSMGVRITPPERMAVQNSNLFYMQATSAETNVLNVASSLGHECLALTKFVKGSLLRISSSASSARGTSALRVSKSNRAGRGAIGTSSTLRIPALGCAHRVSGMTVLVKLVGHFLSKILISSVSSGRRVSAFSTCPA